MLWFWDRCDVLATAPIEAVKVIADKPRIYLNFMLPRLHPSIVTLRLFCPSHTKSAKPRNKHSFRDVTCCQLQVRVTWRAGADAWSSAHISRLSRFVLRGRWMLWPIKYIIDVSVSVTSHIRIERNAAMGDSLKSESFIMHDLK